MSVPRCPCPEYSPAPRRAKPGQPRHPVPQFPHLQPESPELWEVAPVHLGCSGRVPGVGPLPLKRQLGVWQLLVGLCEGHRPLWLRSPPAQAVSAGPGVALAASPSDTQAGDSTCVNPWVVQAPPGREVRAGCAGDAGLGFRATSCCPAPAEDLADEGLWGTDSPKTGTRDRRPYRETSQRRRGLGGSDAPAQCTSRPSATPNSRPSSGVSPRRSPDTLLPPGGVSPRSGDASSSFSPRPSLIRTFVLLVYQSGA